jgi:hypothetical protein
MMVTVDRNRCSLLPELLNHGGRRPKYMNHTTASVATPTKSEENHRNVVCSSINVAFDSAMSHHQYPGSRGIATNLLDFIEPWVQMSTN